MAPRDAVTEEEVVVPEPKRQGHLEGAEAIEKDTVHITEEMKPSLET